MWIDFQAFFIAKTLTPKTSKTSTDLKKKTVSKLDEVVNDIYTRMDDGMIPSDITSPDTTICILSGEQVCMNKYKPYNYQEYEKQCFAKFTNSRIITNN